MIKDLLSSVVGIYIVLLVMRLIAWTVLERFFTAHRFNPRAVIVSDLATTIFLVTVTAPIVTTIMRMPHW